MTKAMLRTATAGDVPAIAAIYRPAVLEGTASFELEPPGEEEMLRRFRAIADAGYPYFVAEMDGRIAGYAYANAYRQRNSCALALRVIPFRVRSLDELGEFVLKRLLPHPHVHQVRSDIVLKTIKANRGFRIRTGAPRKAGRTR